MSPRSSSRPKGKERSAAMVVVLRRSQEALAKNVPRSSLSMEWLTLV